MSARRRVAQPSRAESRATAGGALAKPSGSQAKLGRSRNARTLARVALLALVQTTEKSPQRAPNLAHRVLGAYVRPRDVARAFGPCPSRSPLTPTRTPDSALAPSAAPRGAARGARQWPRPPRCPRCHRRLLGDHHTCTPKRRPSRFGEEAAPTRASRHPTSRRRPRGSCAVHSARRFRARATSPPRSRPTGTLRRASSSPSSSRAPSSASQRLSPPARSAPRPREAPTAARALQTSAAMETEAPARHLPRGARRCFRRGTSACTLRAARARAPRSSGLLLRARRGGRGGVASDACASPRAATSARVGAGPSRNTTAPAASARKSPSGTRT